MSTDWKRKNMAVLKWFGAGPAFLLYLILLQDMKLFENGVLEGLLLCAIFILAPAAAVFAVYWPQQNIQETIDSDKGSA